MERWHSAFVEPALSTVRLNEDTQRIIIGANDSWNEVYPIIAVNAPLKDLIVCL